MITKVISAFPGTGKSYFADTHNDVLDLDSNSFTSGHTPDGKVRNPDFPNNYIAAIEEQLGKHSVLLVETFKDSTTKLAEDLLAVLPTDQNSPVRVPGFRGSERREKFVQDGEIEIADEDWQKFAAALENQKTIRADN